MGLLKNIAKDMYLRRPPAWMVLTVLVLVIGSWLPLVVIAWQAARTHALPPIHIFQDMFYQPKYTAQDISVVFKDRRAMRPPVPGTVAQGASVDAHLQLGYRITDAGEPVTITDAHGNEVTAYYDGYPEGLEITPSFLQRGRQRYNIYCYPCHGTTGVGDGPVNQRATQLTGAGPAGVWVMASNLQNTDDSGLIYGPQRYSNGRLFNVISNGIRNMPAYASQITPQDRWAIVAYVRALQLSQNPQLMTDPQE